MEIYLFALQCHAMSFTLRIKTNHKSPRPKKTQKPESPNSPNQPMICRSPPQMEIYLFALQCHVRYSPHAKLHYVEPANQDTTLRAFFYITYCYCCSGYVLKSFWLQNYYLLYTANNLIVRFLGPEKKIMLREIRTSVESYLVQSYVIKSAP